MSPATQPPRRDRLSVAMIVRDEETVLADALASVRSIADEIIVHDTGSHDASREIARRHGAHIIEGRWEDDFALARNKCLDAVTGDWVLWLDAGERLTAESAAGIREFIASGDATPRAFVMLVEVPGTAPDVPSEQIGCVRLHRNDRRLRFTGPVLETLRPALSDAGIAWQLSPWHIVRTAREHDLEVKRRKTQRKLPLLDREIRRLGPLPHLLVAKGEILSSIGDQPQAADCFRHAIDAAERGSIEMLSGYYGLLATFDPQAVPTDAQVRLAVEALEHFPLDTQLLCAMGSYLQTQGHAELAQRSYRLAHEFGSISPETWHVREIGAVAAICLSLSLQLQNNDDEALRVLDEALQRHPSSDRLLCRSLEVHIRHARVAEALAMVDRLPAHTPVREALRSAVRGACQAARQNWIFALSYLETAYDAGCRDIICLRWLTVSLLASGNFERGREILALWAQAAPHDVEMHQLRALVEQAKTDAAPPADAAPSGSSPAGDETKTPIPAPHIRSHAPLPHPARVDS